MAYIFNFNFPNNFFFNLHFLIFPFLIIWKREPHGKTAVLFCNIPAQFVNWPSSSVNTHLLLACLATLYSQRANYGRGVNLINTLFNYTFYGFNEFKKWKYFCRTMVHFLRIPGLTSWHNWFLRQIKTKRWAYLTNFLWNADLA